MIKYLIRVINSLIFNLKVLDFKVAIKLPILISNNVKYMGSRKDCISFSCEPYYGMVKLGGSDGALGIWRYDRCHGIIDFTDGCVQFGKAVNISPCLDLVLRFKLLHK